MALRSHHITKKVASHITNKVKKRIDCSLLGDHGAQEPINIIINRDWDVSKVNIIYQNTSCAVAATDSFQITHWTQQYLQIFLNFRLG